MADMSIKAEFTADTSSFESGVKKCQESLTGLGKTLEKATGKISNGLKGWGLNLDKFYQKGSGILSDFGIDIDKFASHFGVSGKVVAGLTAATVAMTKFGQEMHGAMAEIAKGTGATGEALLGLQESAKDAMIKGVGAPVKEIGVMIADLNTRFGATGDTLVNLTDKFDQFGSVTGVNTKEAINSVADVIEKWGMNIEDINPLLDQLTKASQDSGASVQDLMRNLKQGKTIFSQFGMSATRSIAFLESLAKAGIDTNTAMTGMRYALAKFSAEGRNAQDAFREVGEAIKNAASDSEALNIALETFGTKAGAEMINVFRGGTASIEEFEKALVSAGGALEATDEASRTSKDAMEDLMNTLKGTFAGFGEGFDYLIRDILDSVRMLVEWIAPVIKPLGNIFRDVFAFIGNLLKTLVGAFVEFQTRYNVVFQQVVNVLDNVYKAFHSILKNIQDVFGNVFGFIFALLDKNWALAWEYAKNSLMKFADTILNVFSMVIQNLSPMINKVIDLVNKVREGFNVINKILGKDQLEAIEHIGDDFDLSDTLGLTKLIEDSNKKIEELTGKTKQKLIGTLGEVKNVSIDILGTVTSGMEGVASATEQWADKIEQQEIDRLNREKQNAVIRAQNEGKTEEEIFAIRQAYDYKIRIMQEERLLREKKSAIEQAKNAEEVARIETYYSNEIAKLFEENEQRIQKAQEKRSQWDGKLLAQKIAMAEEDEALSVKAAESEKKTEQEIYELKQGYGKRIIELKREQLEIQRLADLEGVEGAEETAKVNAYYNNEIARMVKEETEKRLLVIKEEKHEEIQQNESALSKILDRTKRYARLTADIFAGIGKAVGKVFSGIKKVATKIFTSLTSAFKSVKGIFEKLFDLNPTESLTAMLEYEDKVLTFFTFTIKEIPGYVESALSSVVVLMQKLFEQIDMGEVADIIQKVIDSFAKNAPVIVKQVAKLFTQLVETVSRTVIENADVIVNAFGSIFMSVLDNLPTILKAFVTAILAFIKSLGTFINENAEQIVNDLVAIVTNIVHAIIDFITTGGWKTLLNAIVNIIKAVNKAITDNIPAIVDAIIAMLPDLVDALIQIIVDINKSASKIMRPLARLVVAVVKALIDLLTNEEMIQTSIDALMALIEAIVSEIIPQLPAIIIKLVLAIINVFIKCTPKLVIGIVEGLIKGFAKTNWLQVVKDIFKEFINGIKNLFGIHSPSTLFAGFGENMVQGLVNGLKNIWSKVSGIFSNLFGNIKNFFGNLLGNLGGWAGNIGSTIGNAFSSLASNIGSWMSNIFSNVSSWASKIGDKIGSIGSGIKNAASGAVSKVKSFFGFATGTPSAPAGLAVVGERGPELVDFRGGERVYNNADSKKIMTGGKQTSNAFNITFNNTSQTTAFTVMREMKRYSRQLAFNGVL